MRMKNYSNKLTFLTSFISILATNLIINQPIKASEVSEMDTISYHNYQLEKCILGKNLSYELAGMQSNGQLDESSIR